MRDKSDDSIGNLDTILAKGDRNLKDLIFTSSNARGLPGEWISLPKHNRYFSKQYFRKVYYFSPRQVMKANKKRRVMGKIKAKKMKYISRIQIRRIMKRLCILQGANYEYMKETLKSIYSP